MSRKAYKLVRKINNKYYPLFVFAKEEFVTNEWIVAKCGEKADSTHVKSKLGKLAYRPGLHLCEFPSETHIGKKGPSGKIEYLPKDHVWVEVRFNDHINYQIAATESGRNAKGKVIARDACLDYIPESGFYYYNTSSQATVRWIIAGEMKIVRELNDIEVIEICEKHNLPYLKRENIA